MENSQNEQVILENYDGSKAYHGRIRYTVNQYFNQNGALFALPEGRELEDLVGSISEEELKRKFPVLRVVNPDHGHEQALARRATPDEEKLVYEELNQMIGDMKD